MNEKFLPIGSVVLLKNATKTLMVTGYANIDLQKKDKLYDYSGCLFPEGVISTEQTTLFNHADIEKVLFVGYSNDDQKDFGKKLLETLTEENIKIMLEKAKEM